MHESLESWISQGLGIVYFLNAVAHREEKFCRGGQLNQGVDRDSKGQGRGT